MTLHPIGKKAPKTVWVALCNGGPNDTTVGKECNSLGAALGMLEHMMKNLGATIGQIERVEDGTSTAVQTEAEASTWEHRTRQELGLAVQSKIDWAREQEIVDDESSVTGDDCSDELEILRSVTE